MGSTLFDQLKKTGLVDEKKAKQVKKEKHQQSKQKNRKNVTKETKSQKVAKKSQAEKTARDRALNQQQKLAAEQKAITAQITQLIQQNRIKEKEGEIRYHFSDGNKVQRLYISEAVQKQLISGQLVIVKIKQKYELVPSAVGDKIKARDPKCVISIPNNTEKTTSEEDPYAQYQVPDDLMW